MILITVGIGKKEDGANTFFNLKKIVNAIVVK